MPSGGDRFVFLHLDGVVMENILAPILLSLVKRLGGEYTAELENNVFSCSREHAAAYLIEHLNLGLSVSEVIRLYLEARRDYLQTNQIRPRPGLTMLLALLRSCGYRIVAYGGADPDYYLAHTESFREHFDDDYIQTRDFRPGVRHIVREIRCGEVLFIDDTVAVAREAKELGVPFIGVSTGHSFSFQYREMELFGVPSLVRSLSEIDIPMLSRAMAHIQVQNS